MGRYYVTSIPAQELEQNREVGTCSVVGAGMYSTLLAVSWLMLLVEWTCIVGDGWGEGLETCYPNKLAEGHVIPVMF